MGRKQLVDLFITYIVPASTFLPIIVFLLRKGAATKPLRIIFTYLVVAITINVIGTAMSKFGIHNLWLLHIYTVLETVILLYFFIHIMHDRKAKNVLWFLLVAFPFACIINLVFFQNSSNFNSYTRSIETILIIVASSWYWFSNTKESLDTAWGDNPFNWIISGLLLYFASSLFLFLFSNYLLANVRAKPGDPIWDIVWVSHGVLLMIMYVLFAIGFIRSRNDR